MYSADKLRSIKSRRPSNDHAMFVSCLPGRMEASVNTVEHISTTDNGATIAGVPHTIINSPGKVHPTAPTEHNRRSTTKLSLKKPVGRSPTSSQTSTAARTSRGRGGREGIRHHGQGRGGMYMYMYMFMYMYMYMYMYIYIRTHTSQQKIPPGSSQRWAIGKVGNVVLGCRWVLETAVSNGPYR